MATEHEIQPDDRRPEPEIPPDDYTLDPALRVPGTDPNPALRRLNPRFGDAGDPGDHVAHVAPGILQFCKRDMIPGPFYLRISDPGSWILVHPGTPAQYYIGPHDGLVCIGNALTSVFARIIGTGSMEYSDGWDIEDVLI